MAPWEKSAEFSQHYDFLEAEEMEAALDKQHNIALNKFEASDIRLIDDNSDAGFALAR